MKRYQIGEYADWFSQKELIEKIKELESNKTLTITRLDDYGSENGDMK